MFAPNFELETPRVGDGLTRLSRACPTPWGRSCRSARGCPLLRHSARDCSRDPSLSRTRTTTGDTSPRAPLPGSIAARRSAGTWWSTCSVRVGWAWSTRRTIPSSIARWRSGPRRPCSASCSRTARSSPAPRVSGETRPATTSARSRRSKPRPGRPPWICGSRSPVSRSPDSTTERRRRRGRSSNARSRSRRATSLRVGGDHGSPRTRALTASTPPVTSITSA